MEEVLMCNIRGIRTNQEPCTKGFTVEHGYCLKSPPPSEPQLKIRFV